MTEVTVCFQTNQSNIDPDFFKQLNTLAEQFGLHFTQKYQKPKIEESQLSLDEFIQKSAEFSKRIGPQKYDSAKFIRQDRDTR